MKQAKVTSVEVARRSGVSQSAVSRAFTPGASVSAKTAAKVHKVAEEMGYRPNAMARTLITGKSKVIGFIVAYLDNQFYPESLQKLSECLQQKGYHILIFTVDNKPEQVKRTIAKMHDYQVDAIIAASVSLGNDITERCHTLGVPLVLFNRSQDSEKVSYVTSDNVEGGRKVAHHFADIGVSRPAYLAGWSEASTQRDREVGFRTGLAECGLQLFARGEGEFDFETAKQATRDLFASTKKPDALFVANDHMAFAAMDVLRYELDLRIPQDVAVAGYDDVAIASWPAYDLTTVRQAADDMVHATVEALMRVIDEPLDTPVKRKINGPLIIRSSTRRIPTTTLTGEK